MWKKALSGQVPSCLPLASIFIYVRPSQRKCTFIGGRRGGQIRANVSLFIKPITGYHPKRSVSSVITIRKDWKPLNNGEQKMEFCVFSSTFCHSRELRFWLWNLWDAISWAIIKWNWSARVYKINTTQNKHTTLNTDNTGFQQSTADFVHLWSTSSSIASKI